MRKAVLIKTVLPKLRIIYGEDGTDYAFSMSYTMENFRRIFKVGELIIITPCRYRDGDSREQLWRLTK